MRTAIWGLALGIVCLVLLAGCWTYVQYEGKPAPVDQPRIELDIDRAKPRPPLKQQPAKPTPKKVK